VRLTASQKLDELQAHVNAIRAKCDGAETQLNLANEAGTDEYLKTRKVARNSHFLHEQKLMTCTGKRLKRVNPSSPCFWRVSL